MEAVLEWSWDLLDDDVADLLVQLAVFTGGWTLRAAEAICDDATSVVDRLDALVASSLVEVTDDLASTRFWMLEPVRQFAVARLQADPRHARLRDRHLVWWVQHATGRPVGEQWLSGRWAAELRDEFDNFRAAVTHAVRTQRVDDAATLLGAAHAFVMDSFGSMEVELLVNTVLADHPDPPARLWLVSSINRIGLNDYHAAKERCEIALERAAAEGDVACQAWAADWLAATLANSEPERAGALADAALSSAREVGDRELLVVTLVWAGMAAYIAGDVVGALGRFEEAEDVRPSEWSLASAHLDRSRAFVALDIPEVGDPDALLDASIAAAPRRGLHQRLAAFYHAFPRARDGDSAAVAALLNEAFELAITCQGANAYTDPAIAAAELLEVLGHPDEAAAIIAALHRQLFTLPELYHRYLRARARLPAAARPNRRLTLHELRDVVDAQLAVVSGESTAPA